MHALIDLDIVCYSIGSARDDTGLPIPWPLVQARVDTHIDLILEATEADTWQGYLTGSGNFRDEIATIKPYKGHRDRSDRPFWYPGIYNYLRDQRRAIVVHGMEADDQLSIEHSNSDFDTIICSCDKDLLQVPGWHYTWLDHGSQEEPRPFFLEEIDGLRNFYRQLLTGDRVDNILGLFGVGNKAACVKRLDQYTTELEMFREVKEQYELRFGTYWDMFMCENGRLLWMKRTHDDDWWNRQKRLTHAAEERTLAENDITEYQQA